MVNERGYFYIGGLFSLAIYVLIIYLVFTYMTKDSDNIKHFKSKKENFLEIAIVTEKKKEKIIKKPKVVKKPVKKVEKKKKKPKIKEVKKTITKKQNIQDLFGTIKTKNIQKNERVRKKAKPEKIEITHESVETKSVAKEIVKDFDFKKPDITISSSVGEYNEYYGKISEILNEKWHNTYSTAPGVSAWADIIIDPSGRFDYRLTKPSYNDEFNAMLMDFLESMKEDIFPIPENGKIIRLNVEFKEIF